MNNIKNNTTMELHYILDYAMRDKKNASYGTGYEIDGRKYDRYMSNEDWNSYLEEEMSDVHREQYEKGDGGEIKEKRGRWGMYPPKMACYGSSSRIIYTLLRNVPGIEFEKKFATRVGHSANLDAYLRKGYTDIFLEAKCREIYSSHNKIDIGNAYKPVYEHIKQCNGKFGFSDDPSSESKKFKCSFYYNGTPIIHFDIKQLICHFLAIAANYLKPKKREVAMDVIRFVYFIYNPTELNNKELSNIYSKTIEEINTINTSELFKAVFDFQKKNLEVEKEIPKFEFVLADQNNIMNNL